MVLVVRVLLTVRTSGRIPPTFSYTDRTIPYRLFTSIISGPTTHSTLYVRKPDPIRGVPRAENLAPTYAAPIAASPIPEPTEATSQWGISMSSWRGLALVKSKLE
ncbi:hypothetical protein BDV11DRAFT_180646 [Aspergillus similis]